MATKNTIFESIQHIGTIELENDKYPMYLVMFGDTEITFAFDKEQAPHFWFLFKDILEALNRTHNGAISDLYKEDVDAAYKLSSAVRFSYNNGRCRRSVGNMNFLSFAGVKQFAMSSKIGVGKRLVAFMKNNVKPDLTELLRIAKPDSVIKRVKAKPVAKKDEETTETVIEDECETVEVSPSGCTDLVRVDENNHVVVDSLMIAAQFGRRHDNVLQAVRELNCTKSFRLLNFQEGQYHDKNGQKRPMYIMTRDGCVFLIAKLKGAQAGEFLERYIAEFNRMEEKLRKHVEADHQHIVHHDSSTEALKILASVIERQEKFMLAMMDKINAGSNNTGYTLGNKSLDNMLGDLFPKDMLKS